FICALHRRHVLAQEHKLITVQFMRRDQPREQIDSLWELLKREDMIVNALALTPPNIAQNAIIIRGFGHLER
ncbi:MAG: hypothetical protein ACRD22_16350, partial [Terriglobia bacterium]